MLGFDLSDKSCVKGLKMAPRGAIRHQAAISAARQAERKVDQACLILFVCKFDIAKSIQRGKLPCAVGLPCSRSSSRQLGVFPDFRFLHRFTLTSQMYSGTCVRHPLECSITFLCETRAKRSFLSKLETMEVDKGYESGWLSASKE